MQTLYVRTAQQAASFFRCGIEFTPAWQKVEVDAATASRLGEEQMLHVSVRPPQDDAPPQPLAVADVSSTAKATASKAPALASAAKKAGK